MASGGDPENVQVPPVHARQRRYATTLTAKSTRQGSPGFSLTPMRSGSRPTRTRPLHTSPEARNSRVKTAPSKTATADASSTSILDLGLAASAESVARNGAQEAKPHAVHHLPGRSIDAGDRDGPEVVAGCGLGGVAQAHRLGAHPLDGIGERERRRQKLPALVLGDVRAREGVGWRREPRRVEPAPERASGDDARAPRRVQEDPVAPCLRGDPRVEAVGRDRRGAVARQRPPADELGGDVHLAQQRDHQTGIALADAPARRERRVRRLLRPPARQRRHVVRDAVGRPAVDRADAGAVAPPAALEIARQIGQAPLVRGRRREGEGVYLGPVHRRQRRRARLASGDEGVRRSARRTSRMSPISAASGAAKPGQGSDRERVRQTRRRVARGLREVVAARGVEDAAAALTRIGPPAFARSTSAALPPCAPTPGTSSGASG